MIPANTKNMVTLYKNSFEDPRKQININRLMPLKSIVKKTISLKIEKSSMPELKTNMSLLIVDIDFKS